MNMYECERIDFFFGMTHLRDYIKISTYYQNIEYQSMRNHYYHEKALKSFLISCFVHLYSCVSDWQGDILENDIVISAIPHKEGPFKFLALNEGKKTFIISERSLDPVLGNVKRLKLENLIPEAMIEYFQESYDLVEKLYSEASKKHVAATHELEPESLCFDKPIYVTAIGTNISKIKSQTGFDLGQFEKIK